MENLSIGENRYNKNTLKMFLLVFFCVQIYWGCKSTTKASKETQLLRQIEFQHGFSADTVSLKIGQKYIVKDAILTTGQQSGKADLDLIFYKRNHFAVIELEEGGQFKLRLKGNFVLQVQINDVKNELVFSSLIKKYVGITKTRIDSLYIIQSDFPFAYD